MRGFITFCKVTWSSVKTQHSRGLISKCLFSTYLLKLFSRLNLKSLRFMLRLHWYLNQIKVKLLAQILHFQTFNELQYTHFARLTAFDTSTHDGFYVLRGTLMSACHLW